MRFSVEGISTAVLESAAKSRVVPLERKEVMALNNLKRLVQQDRSAGIPVSYTHLTLPTICSV